MVPYGGTAVCLPVPKRARSENVDDHGWVCDGIYLKLFVPWRRLQKGKYTTLLTGATQFYDFFESIIVVLAMATSLCRNASEIEVSPFEMRGGRIGNRI